MGNGSGAGRTTAPESTAGRLERGRLGREEFGRTRPVSRPRWMLSATQRNVSHRFRRRDHRLGRRPKTTVGTPSRRERTNPLFGFMSVPVSRRFPIRRSTLLMAVAFVGFGALLYSYPPQSTSGGAFIKGSDGQTYFVPGAISASTTTTTTTSTTTTHHSTAKAPGPRRRLAPLAVRFPDDRSIRVHHDDHRSRSRRPVPPPRPPPSRGRRPRRRWGSASTSSSSTTTSP